MTLAAIQRRQQRFEPLQQPRTIDRHGRRRNGAARPHGSRRRIREDAIELLLDIHDASRRVTSSPRQDGHSHRRLRYTSTAALSDHTACGAVVGNRFSAAWQTAQPVDIRRAGPRCLRPFTFAAEPIPLTLKPLDFLSQSFGFLIFVRDVSMRAIDLSRSIRAIVHVPVIRNL